MQEDAKELLLPAKNASKVPPHLKYRSCFLLGLPICMEDECAFLNRPSLGTEKDLAHHLQAAHHWSALAIRALQAYHESLSQHPHHIGFFCVHPDCHENLNEHTRDMKKQALIHHYGAHHKDSKDRSYHFIALARSHKLQESSNTMALSQYSTEDLQEALDGLLVEFSVHISSKRRLLSRLNSLSAHTEHVAHSQLPAIRTEGLKTSHPRLAQSLRTFAAMIDTERAICSEIRHRDPCIYTDEPNWLEQDPVLPILDLRAVNDYPTSPASHDGIFGTIISQRIGDTTSLAATLCEATNSRIVSISQASFYILQERVSDGTVGVISQFQKGIREERSQFAVHRNDPSKLVRLILEHAQGLRRKQVYLLNLSRDRTNLATSTTNFTMPMRRGYKRFLYSEYPLFRKHMKTLAQASSFECPICPNSPHIPGGLVRAHFQKAEDHRLWLDILGDDIEGVFESTHHSTAHRDRLERLRQLVNTSLNLIDTPHTHKGRDVEEMQPHDLWKKLVMKMKDEPFVLSEIKFPRWDKEENLLRLIKTANILHRFDLAEFERRTLDAAFAKSNHQTSEKHHRGDTTILEPLKDHNKPCLAAVDVLADLNLKMENLNVDTFKLLCDLAGSQLEWLQGNQPGALEADTAARVHELLAWIALQSQNRLAQNARSNHRYLFYHHAAYHVQFQEQTAAVLAILDEFRPHIASAQLHHHDTTQSGHPHIRHPHTSITIHHA